MTCCGSFPSCREENFPDPKSGRDLDPEKQVCATSCQEDVINHFCVFFATDPGVVESVIGSVSVEHP